MTSIAALLGKTLVSIDGLEVGSGEVIWTCADGSKYQMYHSQGCCESVEIEDIEGDMADLFTGPVVIADEPSSEDKTMAMLALVGAIPEVSAESYTWTFYRVSTAKGMVVIRWLGESNGYYSENVNFEEIEP